MADFDPFVLRKSSWIGHGVFRYMFIATPQAVCGTIDFYI
jgi:hypothetical protein